MQAIVDERGNPLAISIDSAGVGECQMVADTFRSYPFSNPKYVVGDKGYDSDRLQQDLFSDQDIFLLSPRRKNRKARHPKWKLVKKYYRKRYVVERFFAWFKSYRKVSDRFSVKWANYVGLCHLACAIVLLKRVFG